MKHNQPMLLLTVLKFTVGGGGGGGGATSYYKIQQTRSVLLSYDSSKTSPTNFKTISVFILHYTRMEKLD